MSLISNQDTGILEGDDRVHQVLTSLRRRLAENPTDSLNIIDRMAAQFGVMPTDSFVALSVAQTCGYQTSHLLA